MSVLCMYTKIQEFLIVCNKLQSVVQASGFGSLTKPRVRRKHYKRKAFWSIAAERPKTALFLPCRSAILSLAGLAQKPLSAWQPRQIMCDMFFIPVIVLIYCTIKLYWTSYSATGAFSPSHVSQLHPAWQFLVSCFFRAAPGAKTYTHKHTHRHPPTHTHTRNHTQKRQHATKTETTQTNRKRQRTPTRLKPIHMCGGC